LSPLPLFLILFLLGPHASAQDVRGKGFKGVVKHIETKYGARKTKIPFLGLANFAVKIIRPAGVKGFKVAIFENQDFVGRPEVASSFRSVMREAYNKGWMPLVQFNTKRDGNSRVFVYSKYSGKDVEFAVVTLNERDAMVAQVKFNPDAAARFLENPKIMGISIGGSVRGNGNNAGNVANRAPRRSAGATRGDRTIAEMEPAPATDAKPRPVLTAANAEENNPPVQSPVAPENKAPAPVENKDSRAAPATDPDAIRIETRLVNLNVKAMDRAGQSITNLNLKDFEVYEDGVRQNVEHFKPVNAPVNVVLLLDLSGSTKKKRRAMADAARRFIDALPANDKLSVVAFTRRYRALTGFTSDKTALKNAVEQINKIEGGTAFYDSMWKALDDLDRVNDARKAIVVLTDGEDESLIGDEETAHTFDDLLGRASEEDVTIYPIYFKAMEQYERLGAILAGTGDWAGSDRIRAARAQLEKLADATGGEIVNAQREEDLEAAYDRVATELHTLYSLGYLPDKLKHDGGFRKISVKLTREGAIARTRKGYFDK
jgi:VWFA-related protein